ncbi:Peptidoglycan/LPS O-acetylase OafA/YrhL, contains acyltransferase and SGNH-hydrolase domains [Jatrophihabitans endophyticus]|uniref:Peptidoglycan/LPS O-acetylase OafA/YrhL, contains acyltransferase and SGNH-hydrolase domains n=1 Tax=Jatrophihabitans endophyticus TaxID=1206085 RepID=A0A1M5DQB5_9ACTN|nr:acyltransferase family protein [Jatrophihabitans endophyticus]SHF69228.1 Peptidoglycan/LPS O-acetylase OafA/YrhL, contains acyltransferase and SGNH-hydrolase domains [Jatrophihabitans endophyticus]
MTAIRPVAAARPEAPAATPPRRTPARVRRDLEGLRAVAVLGVVAFHVHPSWLPGGFAGVDVFFVLSGFLITGLLLAELRTTGRIDLRAFWGRRARRLLPASALVAVLTMLASLLLVDSIDAARFAEDGVWVALFSVNWHYADERTSYFADNGATPFTHYWSLGLEEQFYLVWPVLLLGLGLLVARRRTRAVGVLAAAVAGGSFVLAVSLTTTSQPYAYFATYSRVWQLALGALLAVAATRLTPPRRAALAARWAGTAAVVGFYLLAAPDADSYYPGWYALVPTLGAALVIAGGLPGPAAARAARDPLLTALCSRPAQLLGRYSYGWYLWHWPPLVLVPLWHGHPLSARSAVALALLSLLLAAVGYHLVEHPVRATPRLVAHRGRSLALGAVLVVVGASVAVAVGAAADHRTDTARVTDASGRVLVPQPGTAAAEIPQPTRDGCEVGMRANALSGECRYLPDRGRGDVVLVGDSHAAQWFGAVRDVARSRDWGLRVWTRASCPLAEVTKMIDGAPSASCNRWRDDVMRRLVAARPSLVVVAGYVSKIPSLYDPRTRGLVGGNGARALYETGLVRQLQRLRGAGSRVLVIRDNPSFDERVPTCVLSHARKLSKCAETRKHALRSASDLHAARRVPGVDVLDLTTTYCPGGHCPATLDGTLAYRDDNHLTLEMIDRLRPALRGALTRAMA